MTIKCPQCGKPITGRSDKQFCDVFCRAEHNNQKNKDLNKLARQHLQLIRKNRRILKRLCPDQQVYVSREQLLVLQFVFNCFTKVYRSHQGRHYYFSLDYGLSNTNDPKKYLILKWRTFMTTSNYFNI